MDEERSADDGAQPRRLLVERSEFGVEPSARWRPVGPDQDHTELIAAYWQHLAVCTLRERFPVGLVETLAERLGKSNTVYLRRQVSGEYRVPLEELLGWAIACKDISLLPQPDSIVDLYPPGSLPT